MSLHWPAVSPPLRAVDGEIETLKGLKDEAVLEPFAWGGVDEAES
jgi:hypothetical protein